MSNNDKYKHFVDCKCGCGEIMRISYFETDTDSLYFHYYLHGAPFLKRLWNAALYVLGKRSRYGDFGEMILDPEHVIPLIEVLKGYLRAKGLREGEEEGP